MILPAAPASFAESDLARVLQDAETVLGTPLSGRQRERLLAYVALLGQWNTTYNLTAIREPMAVVTQHIIDCLAVVAPLQRMSGNRPLKRVADIGSGAGLPGIVLALAAPDFEVTCVESVGKKAAFIRQATSTLELSNLATVHGRAEKLIGTTYDFLISRAFSTLSTFVRLTSQLGTSDGYWIAMKGKVPLDELAELPPDLEAFHVEQLQVPWVASQRCLIWLRRKGVSERSLHRRKL